MKFRTEIKLKKQEPKIDYNSRIILLGSCFSENIGKKLSYFKFNTFINPFGILFHPKAIETIILYAVQNKEFTENDLFFYNERWHCFDIHSNLSSSDKEAFLKTLNEKIADTKDALQKATHLIITFGTAWVYEYIENAKIVANCHKLPQKVFNKRILSVDEICSSLQNIKKIIKSINENCHIIYTVSPIRHLKDGFVNNQRSKSHLFTAIHQMQNDKSSYFPSYEIVMDELRDYRFYEEDMIHPNKIAIDYIWNCFEKVYLSEKEKNIRIEIDKINKSLNHKVFNLHSIDYQNFKSKLQERINSLNSMYPQINFK